MGPDPTSPIVVRVIEQPAPGTTLADVVLQAVGLTGALLLGAALLGLALGGLFILFRILRPQNSFNGDTSEDYRLNLNSVTR